MIELKEVSKVYDEREIISSLDLVIAAGRTTILIGPSGCGKSTLLRMIIGLVEPDSGSITINGQELTAKSAVELRRGLGYVTQDGGLFPHISVKENIVLMARYLGWDRLKIDGRLRQLTEITRFPREALDRYPAQLSGGQKQRASLMRALMLDPRIILLDEPMGALDPMVRAELQADLRSIFRTLEKTVVMVTHDLAEAAWFGDEILLMRAGRLVQRGTIQALIHQPAEMFVSQFVSAQRQVVGINRGGDL